MNAILSQLQAQQETMQKHFEHLHRHPELAFEENASSAYIAKQLRTWGYEVTEGIGKTGLVGRLKVGDGTASIGLRADTDALPIQEESDLPYKSEVPGKSHMCGHDAHTTMLLGAAQYLARHRNFNGTLNLIFQPAEEIMGGAPAMIKDGLFERFPMDKVFGLHNIPGLGLGKLYFTEGALMAAVDNWEIILTGRGSHGSMPENSIDPLVAGAALVMSLQTVVSRNVGAMDSAVVSVGAFQSGDAGNVIPQSALLRLSIRTRTEATRKLVLDRIRTITEATAQAYNVKPEIHQGQPGAVLTNDATETKTCAEVARRLLGEDNVVMPGVTAMGSEDFAFYAQLKPCVYALIGNGDTAMVHHPKYTFEQSNLPIGAAYWVALAEHYLR